MVELVSMYSKVLDDGSIQVSMEVKIDEEEYKKYQATGETLLGAIGNCFCELIDEKLGDVKDERLLAETRKGSYDRDVISINLLANHEGKEKEVFHTGEGILESVVKAIYKLKDE